MHNPLDTLPMRFDYYLEIAEKWAGLLKPIVQTNSKKNMQITELCPGWAPKILLALHLISFEGTYIALDESPHALKKLEHFSHQINRSYTFKGHTKNILTDTFGATDNLIKNHVLDDIILHAYFPDQSSEKMYTREQLVKNWDYISHDSNLHSTIESITDTLTKKILDEVKNNGFVCIHQYEGYQDKLWNIPFAWEISQKICDTLVDKLRSKSTLKEEVIKHTFSTPIFVFSKYV